MDRETVTEISRIPRILSISALIFIASLELVRRKWIPSFQSEELSLIMVAMASVISITCIILLKPEVLFMRSSAEYVNTRSNPSGFWFSLLSLSAAVFVLGGWIHLELSPPDVGEKFYEFRSSQFVEWALRPLFFIAGVFGCSFFSAIVLRELARHLADDDEYISSRILKYIQGTHENAMNPDYELNADYDDIRRELNSLFMNEKERLTYVILEIEENNMDMLNWDVEIQRKNLIKKVYQERLVGQYRWPTKSPKEKPHQTETAFHKHISSNFDQTISDYLIVENIRHCLGGEPTSRYMVPTNHRVFSRNLLRNLIIHFERDGRLRECFDNLGISAGVKREEEAGLFRVKCQITCLLADCTYRYGISHPLGLQNTEERFNGEIFRQLIKGMNERLFHGRGKNVDGLSEQWVENGGPINLNLIFSDDFSRVVDMGVEVCEIMDYSHSFPSIGGNGQMPAMKNPKVGRFWEELDDIFRLSERYDGS